ncbi:MAG: histidine-type phosphatase [Solobacterium sp.]|nr:histidine-type phosphatase [Solobacterium sp.]
MNNKFGRNLIKVMLSLFLFLQSGLFLQAEEEQEAGYRLKEVVVLSRHNIRAPLSGSGSVLGEATPYEWYEWSSNPSELSLRGGTLETTMGQYFRKWLISEGLVTENWRPDGNEVRFYANAKQRTIATAQYFSSGFLPVANVPIEYHADYDTMDDVFTPKLTFMSDAYRAAAIPLMQARAEELQDSYDLLASTVDYEDSAGRRNGSLPELKDGPAEIVLNLGDEPNMTGALKIANSLTDALILQYYEAPDEKAAAFGHELDREQWQKLADIKEAYDQALFSVPMIAVNVAHPLLQEIEGELASPGRKFTFLCGHDSNIASVLAALDAEEYELADSIEQSTPIGSKLVFEKWADEEDREYIRVRLVYLSPDQMRTISLLDLDHPPMTEVISFRGMTANDLGMYPIEDMREHLQSAILAYGETAAAYGADIPASAGPIPDTAVK